jgi:hypothetical protein
MCKTYARCAALSLALSIVSLQPTAHSAEPKLPAVYARFLLQRPGSPAEELVLIRTEDRVEQRFLKRAVREVWRRDSRGELEHIKAFPVEGKSVHYTAGDLRTIALEPSWSELASLLSEPALTALTKRAGTRKIEGHDAELLTGELRGRRARVLWLPGVALPARIVLEGAAQRTTLELIELTACTVERCAELDDSALRSIEFADLGDMEYDPFVRNFLAREQTHARALLSHAH